MPALKPAHSHGKLNIHSIKSVKVEASPLSAGRSKKQVLAASQTVKQLKTKFSVQKIISHHDVDAQEESKDPHHGGSSAAPLHKNTRNVKLQPIKQNPKIKTLTQSSVSPRTPIHAHDKSTASLTGSQVKVRGDHKINSAEETPMQSVR